MENRSTDQKLIEAIRSGNRIEVLLALKQGANIHARDERGDEVVLLAGRLNHWLVVNDLLRCGANVEAQTVMGGNYLIHYAAANGEWEAMCGLMRLGASLSVVNKYGDTALDLAVRNNHHRVSGLLLQNGGRARSEMYRVRDISMKLVRDYTIEHFGEEYACLCGHGLSHHAVGGCEELIRRGNGDEEICTCDMFADIWGREVPEGQFIYRDAFGDYDLA